MSQGERVRKCWNFASEKLPVLLGSVSAQALPYGPSCEGIQYLDLSVERTVPFLLPFTYNCLLVGMSAMKTTFTCLILVLRGLRGSTSERPD